MIVDSLARADAYVSLHPLFRAGFDYLRRFDPATPDGKLKLDGDRLIAMPQSYATGAPAEKKFEAHRRYIDIQFIFSGEETILHAPIETLVDVLEPHIPERDVAFFRDPAASTAIVLRAGDFAIFHPHDGHKPGCAVSKSVAVRKIVLKIEV